MSLKQSYERYEITEKKKIYSYKNLADLITKNKPFSTLQTLPDVNWINLNITEQVKQTQLKKETNRN